MNSLRPLLSPAKHFRKVRGTEGYSVAKTACKEGLGCADCVERQRKCMGSQAAGENGPPTGLPCSGIAHSDFLASRLGSD